MSQNLTVVRKSSTHTSFLFSNISKPKHKYEFMGYLMIKASMVELNDQYHRSLYSVDWNGLLHYWNGPMDYSGNGLLDYWAHPNCLEMLHSVWDRS